MTSPPVCKELVCDLLQPPANKLMGEGVYDKGGSRSGDLTLCRVAQRKQMGEELYRQLVEFQREGNQDGEDEGRSQDNSNVEEMVRYGGVGNHGEQEDGGEGSRIYEPKVVIEIGENDVRRYTDHSCHQNPDSD